MTVTNLWNLLTGQEIVQNSIKNASSQFSSKVVSLNCSRLINLSLLVKKRVAIDLSVWIYSALKTKYSNSSTIQNSTRTNNNNSYVPRAPHCTLLFNRIITLLRLGIDLVFVADGIAPNIKSKSNLSKNTSNGVTLFNHQNNFKNNPQYSQFYNEAIQFLKLFRHSISLIELSHGEAEACCGLLSESGIVDYTITQDSDCFLFGAKNLLKNIKIQKFHATAELFSVSLIQKNLNLTKSKLILFALLNGSDYTTGVRSIGIKQSEEFLRNLIENENENCLQTMRKLLTKEITVEQFCNSFCTVIDENKRENDSNMFEKDQIAKIQCNNQSNFKQNTMEFIDYSTKTNDEINSFLFQFGLKKIQSRQKSIDKLNEIQLLKLKWNQFERSRFHDIHNAMVVSHDYMYNEKPDSFDSTFESNSESKSFHHPFPKLLSTFSKKYENVSEFDSIVNAYMAPKFEPPIPEIIRIIESNRQTPSRLNTPDLYGMFRFNRNLGFIQRNKIQLAFEQLKRTQFLMDLNFESVSSKNPIKQTNHSSIEDYLARLPVDRVQIIGKINRNSQIFYKLKWLSDLNHSTLNSTNSDLPNKNLSEPFDNYYIPSIKSKIGDSIEENENFSYETSEFLETYSPQLIVDYNQKTETETQKLKGEKFKPKVRKVLTKLNNQQSNVSKPMTEHQTKLTEHFKSKKFSSNESQNTKLNSGKSIIETHDHFSSESDIEDNLHNRIKQKLSTKYKMTIKILETESS